MITAPQIPDDIKAQAELVVQVLPNIWMPGDEERAADAIGLAILVERERCRTICIDQAGRHAAYESGRAEANAARACAKVIMGADPYGAFRATQ